MERVSLIDLLDRDPDTLTLAEQDDLEEYLERLSWSAPDPCEYV